MYEQMSIINFNFNFKVILISILGFDRHDVVPFYYPQFREFCTATFNLKIRIGLKNKIVEVLQKITISLK